MTLPYNGVRSSKLIREDIWPQPSICPKASADPNDRIGFSKYIMDGCVVFDDVIKFYYDQTNEMLGTDFEPPK